MKKKLAAGLIGLSYFLSILLWETYFIIKLNGAEIASPVLVSDHRVHVVWGEALERAGRWMTKFPTSPVLSRTEPSLKEGWFPYRSHKSKKPSS